MLAAPFLSSWGFTFDNLAASPSTTTGTSVTPGASGVEGSWTQIASGANISRDCYWLNLAVYAGFTAATAKGHVLDVGIDPAGGTSYTSVIDNIVCGSSSGNANFGPFSFMLPFFIKNGSSVAVRIQGQAATAGTVIVAAKFWGDPSNPENILVGQFSETIGAISSSGGVSFTPGNAADGTWVSLGTTANDLWWWQLCATIAGTTITLLRTYVDLAVGDATNKDIIQREMIITSTNEEAAGFFRTNNIWLNCFRPVPAGSTLYVRGRCQSAPDSGWSAVAVGIGG